MLVYNEKICVVSASFDLQTGKTITAFEKGIAFDKNPSYTYFPKMRKFFMQFNISKK